MKWRGRAHTHCAWVPEAAVLAAARRAAGQQLLRRLKAFRLNQDDSVRPRNMGLRLRSCSCCGGSWENQQAGAQPCTWFSCIIHSAVYTVHTACSRQTQVIADHAHELLNTRSSKQVWRTSQEADVDEREAGAEEDAD